MSYKDNITLMCKDKEVLEFNLDADYCNVIDKNLLPFSLQTNTVNCISIYKWLNRRALPISRKNAKRLCNLLKVPQDNKEDMVLLVKALSLNDCYWLKTAPTDAWDKVNLYHNRFSETIAHVALTGESSRISVQENTLTPEVATQGVFAKCWKREDSGLYLYKGEDIREVYAEFISSEIADVLHLEHAKYYLTKYNDKLCTKCQNICNENIGLVSASEMSHKWGIYSANFDEWLEIPEIKNDLSNYLTMLIFDGVVGNVDRHLGNWGFLFDIDTNNIYRLQPLMDHNLAININPYSDNPFEVEHPFILNMSVIEVAIEALNRLPQMKNKLYQLDEWYKDLKTQEMFYKLYDSEDELIYLRELLNSLLSGSKGVKRF